MVVRRRAVIDDGRYEQVEEVVKEEEKETGASKDKPVLMSAAEVHARRLSKKRTASVDSDASVYTQNSRLSTLSRDLAMGGVLANIGGGGDTGVHAAETPTATQTQAPRPMLALATNGEPLLHTSWGSAVSSAAPSTPGFSMYTPVAGVLDNQARPGYGMFDGPMQSAHVEDAPKSPNAMAGFASMMRQRLEEDRIVESRLGNADAGATVVDADGHGLGDRIVVEDEDELPSRIVNSTFDSQAETTLDADASSANHSTSTSTSAHTVMDARHTPDSSSEPELLSQLDGHLAPLVVTNRTPSPSVREGGSDDGRRCWCYQRTNHLFRQHRLPLLLHPQSEPRRPARHRYHPLRRICDRHSLSCARPAARQSLGQTSAVVSFSHIPMPRRRPKVSPVPVQCTSQRNKDPRRVDPLGRRRAVLVRHCSPGHSVPSSQMQQQQRAVMGPPRPNALAAIHMGTVICCTSSTEHRCTHASARSDDLWAHGKRPYRRIRTRFYNFWHRATTRHRAAAWTNACARRRAYEGPAGWRAANEPAARADDGQGRRRSTAHHVSRTRGDSRFAAESECRGLACARVAGYIGDSGSYGTSENCGSKTGAGAGAYPAP